MGNCGSPFFLKNERVLMYNMVLKFDIYAEEELKNSSSGKLNTKQNNMAKKHGERSTICPALIALMLMALMMMGMTVCVSADTVANDAAAQAPVITGVANGAYEIAKYDFDAVVDKSHAYQIKEKISVNIPDDLQRIQFTLPNGNFRISGLQVNGEKYKVRKVGKDGMVIITDEDQLTKGQHTFEICYNLREYADRDESRDILYFDVLLPSWLQPITEVNIRVQFPEDFPWDDMQYYAGQFGVQNVDTKLDYTSDPATHIVSIRGERLPENFGIALKAELPNAYWEGMLDGAWATRFMFILSAAATAILFILWLIGGRDPRLAKIRQVHPVDGVTPVEMGYIFIGRVRVRDIIAMIVDLAIKGYLTISEYAPKKYRLIRREDPTGEAKFIRNAYDMIFEDVVKDRWIEMGDLVHRLRRIKKTISEDIAAGFSNKEMLAYTPLSKTFRVIGTIIVAITTGLTTILRYPYVYAEPNIIEGIVTGLIAGGALTMLCRQFDRYYYAERRNFTIRLIALTVLYLLVPIYIGVQTILLTGQWLPAILTAVLLILGAFLVVIMRARAKGNAALTNRFMQLRHFIYHPTPKEFAQATYTDANSYYYEIVPYAFLFNGLESWAITFRTLNISKPEWYSEDMEGSAITNLRMETSTVVDYARDIKAFARTIEDAYHARGRHRDK